MDRLDQEVDQLADKAIDKLMARTQDLDKLADLLMEKGLGRVDHIVDEVVNRFHQRLIEIISSEDR